MATAESSMTRCLLVLLERASITRVRPPRLRFAREIRCISSGRTPQKTAAARSQPRQKNEQPSSHDQHFTMAMRERWDWSLGNTCWRLRRMSYRSQSGKVFLSSCAPARCWNTSSITWAREVVVTVLSGGTESGRHCLALGLERFRFARGPS